MLGYGKLLTGVESIFGVWVQAEGRSRFIRSLLSSLLFDATIILQILLYDSSISYEWSFL
jgi:hypothetical protein